MRKLYLTCECGQRMQVPRSAIGRTGMCPRCSRKTLITAENATATPRPGRAQVFTGAGLGKGGKAPSEEAKKWFARAADLYCEGRYGAALAIFDALAKQYPGSPEIESARAQCMEARNRTPIALPGPESAAVAEGEFSEETAKYVRRIVMQKMFHGATDEVQLRAAELAARMMGVLDGQTPPSAAADAPEGADTPAPPEDVDAPPEAQPESGGTNVVDLDFKAEEPQKRMRK